MKQKHDSGEGFIIASYDQGEWVEDTSAPVGARWAGLSVDSQGEVAII